MISYMNVLKRTDIQFCVAYFYFSQTQSQYHSKRKKKVLYSQGLKKTSKSFYIIANITSIFVMGL